MTKAELLNGIIEDITDNISDLLDSYKRERSSLEKSKYLARATELKEWRNSLRELLEEQDDSIMSDYQSLAMRTNDGKCHDRLHKISLSYNPVFSVADPGELLNGALGLTGEAGEVSDMIKKYIFHGHDLDRNEFIKELGDVCWYIALLCTAIDVDLSEVMSRNIEKLKARYPQGFSESASINRTE